MRLLPALRQIYRDQHHFQVIQKGAQVQCSEYLVNTSLWGADTGQGGRGNVLYVMPTQGQMDDFSQARFDRAIAESPYLQRRLRPAPPGKGGPARVRLKSLGDGYIYFRGAENPRQLISVDADILALDEFDLMPEGTLSRAQQRLASSSLGRTRVISTPRYPEAGINRLFLQSDQNYYFLKCSACGASQRLLWYENVDQKNFQIVCRKTSCRKPLDLWAPGRWLSFAPNNSDIRGYHLSRLYSPYANLRQLVYESQDPSPAAQQEFQNSVLGETYVTPGGSITLDKLDRCRRDYVLTGGSKADCFMGVDVGTVLNVVIREPLNPERTRTRLVFAGEVKDFDELERLALLFNVKGCVVDEQPESRAARAFCQGNRFFGVARYSRSEPGVDWGRENGISVCRANRTSALEEAFFAIESEVSELPRNARELGGRIRDGIGEYYRQLMSLTGTLEQNATGNWVRRYIEKGPDHYAHAEGYCLLASRAYRQPRRATVSSG